MIVIKGNTVGSKNRKTIRMTGRGRRFIGKSDTALMTESSILWQLKDSKVRYEWERMKILAGNEKPLRVQFKYYRKNHRIFDFLNAPAILCDLLVKEGYIPDDNAREFLPVFEPVVIDEKGERLEITILSNEHEK